MVEWTITSKKPYADPFNEVDVDVVFSRGQAIWRVPTFWRGGQSWTVRFAPPVPGEYAYHLESSDHENPDLNGHEGHVTILSYTGSNPLFRHGMLTVSADKRYFQYADGTPFYWLGDTWWTGLSDRLPWEGFKRLAADRRAKGFTVVQIVAGLIPPEELAPIDPGYGNEGGAVWDREFKDINPRYFDYADRRIQHLFAQGLTPAIVGAWGPLIQQTGTDVLKKHWRYLIARYGAYPVIWIAGGEVYDPPETVGRKRPGYTVGGKVQDVRTLGWSEVVRYIRATDPYHHPVSVHDQALIPALQEEALSDYDLYQCGHENWNSIPVELARLQQPDPASAVKPLVVGEIDYEKLFGYNLEDVQRVAFWEAMLNGAAGHTYGANGTWEAYTAKPLLHRVKYSFMTWEEGMKLPGSYQLGIGAKLLRRYPWWQFQPHREWVAPHGDLFAEPRDEALQAESRPFGSSVLDEGNFFLPYAAGIPGKVRVIYIPPGASSAPTILGLESGVHYRAYFWDPILGIKFDLGNVERPAPAAVLGKADLPDILSAPWKPYPTLGMRQETTLSLFEGIRQTDLVATIGASSRAKAGLLLRFQDPDNYLAAIYSAKEQAIYLLDHAAGADGPQLGRTPVHGVGDHLRLSLEVRGGMAAMSMTDGTHTFATPIVEVEVRAGGVGLLQSNDGQSFDHFEVRQSPPLASNFPSDRKLYDAQGRFRGEMRGGAMTLPPWGAHIPGWDAFGKDRDILLDAYRPRQLPYPQDWLLVLDAYPSRRAVDGSSAP